MAPTARPAACRAPRVCTTSWWAARPSWITALTRARFRAGSSAPRGADAREDAHALSPNLRRLSHRLSLAPSRSVHGERVGRDERPDAVRDRGPGRSLLDDEEGRRARARRRSRLVGTEVRAGAEPTRGRHGVDRPLPRRPHGDPPSG